MKKPSPQNKIAKKKKTTRYEENIQNYLNKDSNEVMQELLRKTTEQKANGTFSPEALTNMVNMAGPMLNEEQRKRMESIVNSLL